MTTNISLRQRSNAQSSCECVPEVVLPRPPSGPAGCTAFFIVLQPGTIALLTESWYSTTTHTRRNAAVKSIKRHMYSFFECKRYTYLQQASAL